MELRLIVRTPGKWQGRTIPVNRSPFLIGRDPACQLRPASPLVSGRHCVVTTHDGKIFVRDLGSTNGTFLNGQRLSSEQELRHADVVRIGPLDFEVNTQAAAAVNQTTPLPPPRESLQTPDDTAALLRSLDQKSSFLLQNPGIEADEVPAGRTAIDIRLPPLKRPPEPESTAEVDDEQAPEPPGKLGRLWFTLGKYLGRSRRP